MEVKDLYWAAGFLEGEGYFSRGGSRKTSPVVTASQVTLEPLIHMVKIFGGKINGPYKSQHSRGQPFFRWNAGASLAVGVMMTLYCLLSEKRQKAIRYGLEGWRSGPSGSRNWAAMGRCRNGHELKGENYPTDARSGKKRCRRCGIDGRRRYYEKHRDKWREYAKQKADRKKSKAREESLTLH